MPGSIAAPSNVPVPCSPPAATIVCQAASASVSTHPAGLSPFEMTWRQMPRTMAQFLSVQSICGISAASTTLRAVNAREVLPARLLGKRAENLRLATGRQFPSLIDRVAALAQCRSFRSAPISSLQVRYDPSRHGPVYRREINMGPQQFLPFGGNHALSDASACGRTRVMHRSDLAAVHIKRDLAVTVLVLAQPCFHAMCMVSVSPDGRTCIVLTGGVLLQLHKICLDDAGIWHKASYRLQGLDMTYADGMEATDSGIAFILTKGVGQERTQLHKWRQDGGLRSATLEVDCHQRIAAVSPDGMMLVLQSVGMGARERCLLRFEGAGEAEGTAALRYTCRRLPRQQFSLLQGSMDDAVFSSDGMWLAMAPVESGDLRDYLPHALFFIDVAAALRLTAPGALIDGCDDAIARTHGDQPLSGRHTVAELRLLADGRTIVQIPRSCKTTPEYVRETRFPCMADAVAISKALVHVCNQPAIKRKYQARKHQAVDTRL